MNRLDVRCCCTPRKLLGTLPYGGERVGESVVFALIGYTGNVARRNRGHEKVRLEVAKWVELDRYDAVASLFTRPEICCEGLAYKADGVPIETLRRIPGFVENTGDA